MMIYGETPTQWKNHVVTKIKDNKKVCIAFAIWSVILYWL